MLNEKIPCQSLLDEAGLNRQHVFNVADLPKDLIEPLELKKSERQLILFGHAGRRLWECVQAERSIVDHPIDTFSVRTVKEWLSRACPNAHVRFVYPMGMPQGKHVGLQRLGQIAGWHHPSPFMVGIDAKWGSWFAYRVAILTDTDFRVSEVEDNGDPCVTCSRKPCISACPANALDSGSMNTNLCMEYRIQDNSLCSLACIARQACPVGREHKYEKSQIQHSASGSLAVIKRYHLEKLDAERSLDPSSQKVM